MVSTLKQHKHEKGVLHPPMNALLNEGTPTYWKDDRLPEYLWMGLILMKYPRTKGIERVGNILKAIATFNKTIIKPKLSIILSLSDAEQKSIYKIICNNIDSKILAPLTAIYTNTKYPIFNEYFNFINIPINNRIDAIGKAVELYYYHQSNEATDLRFVAMSMMIFQGKICFPRDASMKDKLINYAYIEHSDERMRQCRPFIRSIESLSASAIEESINKDFVYNFWKEIGLKTEHKLHIINFKIDGDLMDYKDYISGTQDKISHLINEKKELSILDDKFDVIVGTATYALKIFNDVIEKDLGDSILGRNAYRTILESYINMKYLLTIEADNENIWQEYKIYGIGKYKLPLLKEREKEGKDKKTHWISPVIEALVNEIVWEEFLDIDLRYFDRKKIKEKFQEVGEEDLYNILYDYDNNFVHGFWGAVRESAMLSCDNATHKYHSVPDIGFQQKMPSVDNDIYKIICKFSQLLKDSF